MEAVAGVGLAGLAVCAFRSGVVAPPAGEESVCHLSLRVGWEDVYGLGDEEFGLGEYLGLWDWNVVEGGVSCLERWGFVGAEKD